MPLGCVSVPVGSFDPAALHVGSSVKCCCGVVGEWGERLWHDSFSIRKETFIQCIIWNILSLKEIEYLFEIIFN